MGTSIFFKFHPQYNFDGKKVLNIGCGGAKFTSSNVTNLDAYPICEPDIVHDLEKMPLPFKDETFDLIIANHILEHLHNWWECFCECSRVLKKGGKFMIYVPGSDTDSAMGYRDHVSHINCFSFYGTGSASRPGSNAWAKSTQDKNAERMFIISQEKVIKNSSFLKYCPQWFRNWCCEHLRNITSEEGYIFEKR